MKKLNVCVLFGGVSPEHEVSLRSAESVLSVMDPEKYNVIPVGITKGGDWLLYGSDDWSALPSGRWQDCPQNRRAALSPVRGQGLLVFEGPDDAAAEATGDKSLRGASYVRVPVDVVFPVLHGENGEDGTVQGLFRLAGLPFVGCGVEASAASMDKTLTKLIVGLTGVRQAAWEPVTRRDLREPDKVRARIEARFRYPVFVKPAGTGSSVGVSKVKTPDALLPALQAALKYDAKVLVEEFIQGKEVEVAVLGNETPAASVPGEIDSGAEFYDYDAKYLTDTSTLYIPARISEASAEQAREAAILVYRALGCRGLSRVDFFVQADGAVVFNEINTMPGFTSISMYPKLFAASGIPYAQLIDRLLRLALEAADA